ncbi:hypothetical protein [Streptomyces sp. NPDC020298]|uniref:hypothetical protein n=1 Tax=unclassified Streptomyces TaxID=2593676 RepID=UPI0033D14AE2
MGELRQRLEGLVGQVEEQQVVTRRHDMEFVRAMRETQLQHGGLLRSLVAGQRQLLERLGITRTEQ